MGQVVFALQGSFYMSFAAGKYTYLFTLLEK